MSISYKIKIWPLYVSSLRFLHFCSFPGTYFLAKYIISTYLQTFVSFHPYSQPQKILRIPEGLPWCSRIGLVWDQTFHESVNHRSLFPLLFTVTLYAINLLSDVLSHRQKKMDFSLASVWIITQLRMSGISIHGFKEVYNITNENAVRCLVDIMGCHGCWIQKIPRPESLLVQMGGLVTLLGCGTQSVSWLFLPSLTLPPLLAFQNEVSEKWFLPVAASHIM